MNRHEEKTSPCSKFRIDDRTKLHLQGFLTPVMAQENTEVVQEVVVEENRAEQVLMEQETPVIAEEETASEDKIEEKSKNEEVKAGSIAIDETHFPNRAFRLFVETNFDQDKDKSLSKEEINNVTSMKIQERFNQEFTSIKGIEYFTNLQDLSLAAPLKELDLEQKYQFEKS